MTWAQAIIVYAVSWWLILFMALPIGIVQTKVSEPGISDGIPRKTYLGIKFACVTVLAGLATWGIDLLLQSGLIAVK